MYLSRYVKIYRSPTRPGYRLVYSTKRTSMALVPDSALRAMETGSLPESQQRTLHRLGILTTDRDLELEEMAGFFERLNKARSVFTATVVLNLDCNLACAYCFEDGIKTRRYMTQDVVDGFVQHVKTLDFRRIKKVMVDFYGGEPLLSVDAIVYASERLATLGRELDFAYSFRLVTNGTLLTARTVDRLYPLGLKGAKVTLDGPQETHDATRPFASGKGSFNHIVANLRDVCPRLAIQIGGNYTVHTYRAFPRLLDCLAHNGAAPDRIASVKFDPVTVTDTLLKTSPELGLGCASANEEWLYEASTFLREEVLKRGYRAPKITPLACAVDLKDDLVLNVDGTIYKCPGVLGRTEFMAGTIREGMTDRRDIYGPDHWKNPECLECAYLPLCFGGCRYMNMLGKGSMATIDCRRPFFDATLETFLGQEIKYKDRLLPPGSTSPGSPAGR